jgi:tRNA G46 methylase TrmB
MSDPRTDQARLQIQYADAINLNTRFQLHEEFSVNPYNFVLWLFDHMRLPKSARILEVGCGPGWFWRKNAHRIPP